MTPDYAAADRMLPVIFPGGWSPTTRQRLAEELGRWREEIRKEEAQGREDFKAGVLGDAMATLEALGKRYLRMREDRERVLAQRNKILDRARGLSRENDRGVLTLRQALFERDAAIKERDLERTNAERARLERARERDEARASRFEAHERIQALLEKESRAEGVVKAAVEVVRCTALPEFRKGVEAHLGRGCIASLAKALSAFEAAAKRGEELAQAEFVQCPAKLHRGDVEGRYDCCILSRGHYGPHQSIYGSVWS